jgi:hypothetical protein
MATLKRNKYMSEKQLYGFYGFIAGLALATLVILGLGEKEKESRTTLRMTLEDGKRIHLPLSRADESLIDRNGGEIKIKALEFRKKE